MINGDLLYSRKVSKHSSQCYIVAPKPILQLSLSGHLVPKCRRTDVDATQSRRIDVNTTSFYVMCPLGPLLQPILFKPCAEEIL